MVKALCWSVARKQIFKQITHLGSHKRLVNVCGPASNDSDLIKILELDLDDFSNNNNNNKKNNEEERSTPGIFNKAVPPCSKQQTKRACKSPSKTFQTFHKTRPKHFLKAHGRSPRESLQDCGATFVPLRVVTDLLRSTKVAPQSILA